MVLILAFMGSLTSFVSQVGASTLGSVPLLGENTKALYSKDILGRNTGLFHDVNLATYTGSVMNPAVTNVSTTVGDTKLNSVVVKLVDPNNNDVLNDPAAFGMNGTPITSFEGMDYLNNIEAYKFTNASLTNTLFSELTKKLFSTENPANIKRINVSNNNLTNVDSLYRTVLGVSGPLLTGLIELDVDYNTSLTSLSGIANQTNMQRIRANSTGITSLNDFTNLTKIRLIDAESTKITNLTPLAGKNDLNDLYVSNTGVRDLSPLASTPNLKTLRINNDSISDLSPISGASLLNELKANNNNLSSISALANKTNLQYLQFNDNKVSDISSLAASSKLLEFKADNNTITSLSGLENKPSLTYVNANNNKIADISAMASSVTSLNEFKLANNDITDISALKNASKLEWLILDNNHIYDISSLANIPAVQAGKQAALSNQTVTRPTLKYSKFQPLVLDTVVKGLDGSFVPVSSDSGTYSDGTLTYNKVASGTNQVTYNWSQSLPSGTFSGTVTQPLEEEPVGKLSITNKTAVSSDSNKTFNYELKVFDADGKAVEASYLGLDASSSDSNIASFSLKNGENLTIDIPEGGKYEIRQFPADNYASKYQEDGGETKDTPADSAWITKDNLGATNDLVFTNEEVHKLSLSTIFNPVTDAKATYDVKIEYPAADGRSPLTETYTLSDKEVKELTLPLGSKYTITQHAISGSQISAAVKDGSSIVDTIADPGKELTVAGTMGTNDLAVNYAVTDLVPFSISPKDISRYPTVSDFTYSIKLSLPLPDEYKDMPFKAYKKDASGKVIEEVDFRFNGLEQTVTLKDRESLDFGDGLPVNTDFQVKQIGVENYTTNLENKYDLTVTEGQLGQGASASGNIATDSYNMVFVNQTDYAPPITGINDNTDKGLSSSMLLIILASLAGLLLAVYHFVFTRLIKKHFS